MSTFFSDTDNDFKLDANKRLVLETDPAVAGAIKLKNRFQMFKGEWFLDKRIGVPYFELVFIKNPDLDVIRRLLASVILSVEEVKEISELDVYFLPQSRQLAFEFKAVCDGGRVIQGGSGTPFIVTDLEGEVL